MLNAVKESLKSIHQVNQKPSWSGRTKDETKQAIKASVISYSHIRKKWRCNQLLIISNKPLFLNKEIATNIPKHGKNITMVFTIIGSTTKLSKL
jgi:hypothetical protein